MKKLIFAMFFISILLSQIVYITETGSKYHKSGCRYLKKSKIAISLESALSQGYTPCSVCKPPIETFVFINKNYSFILNQNYPNPFNSKTSISYSIKNKAKIKIEIFNIYGDFIKLLCDEFHQVGDYEIQWNSNNLSSGLYFYRLSNQNIAMIKKMILIK